ncbi:MAG TPA: FAD-dependent oxidoreductase, partial [Steroidobacteraceae bacterium]|nr:FAD-dependent oxidoreductase [Steroidobacteraceae bacterium]
MRIAVVGSGISGLASAYLLSRTHEVTLFESADYFGGHTHTHDLAVAGVRYAVDTGFIVFNPRHYPLLSRLFTELGVDSQPTTMSFAVHSERSGLEYNATSVRGLFCQRRNLWSPRFYGMLRDLVRFYRSAPALLAPQAPEVSLREYLRAGRYGTAFREEHLLPMASALWSAPAATVLDFPARFLVRFMANHNMLQLTGRPGWRVVRGGSASYVRALRERWQLSERLGCRVHGLSRDPRGVTLESEAGRERFDQAVLACHSDQALALLRDASPDEAAVLGAIPYQRNEVVLHTDRSFLPRNPKAWAAWNALVPAQPTQHCTVSYCMNLLQGLKSPEPFIVTLNPQTPIEAARVLRRLDYAHPLFTPGAVAAQARRPAIQGQRRTWFAGAYWGFGFHEDGLRSAVEVCRALGVREGLARHRPPDGLAG